MFHDRIAYDEDYSGPALDQAEGERVVAAMGNKDILLMRNHGPTEISNDIGKTMLVCSLLSRTGLHVADARHTVRSAAAGGSRSLGVPGLAHPVMQETLSDIPRQYLPDPDQTGIRQGTGLPVLMPLSVRP